MISLEHIFFSFEGQELLRDFSMTLPDTGAVCLFAPSGSGKTTLLRLLCGLEQPRKGRITGLDGKRLAVLFQEDRLIPHLTAEDNLRLVLPKDRRHEAEDWLDAVGLGADADKTPAQLSGGMNRRLAIARALAFGGDIYLLDEPFQGLDQETAQKTVRLVRERTKDSLLILVTHRLEEAQALCRAIITLGGRPLKILSEENL